MIGRPPARRGRGTAPHWSDCRVRWLVIGWVAFYLDLARWRFGLGVSRYGVSLFVGPATVFVGRQFYRWQRVGGTAANPGAAVFQDYGVSWRITTGVSS